MVPVSGSSRVGLSLKYDATAKLPLDWLALSELRGVVGWELFSSLLFSSFLLLRRDRSLESPDLEAVSEVVSPTGLLRSSSLLRSKDDRRGLLGLSLPPMRSRSAEPALERPNRLDGGFRPLEDVAGRIAGRAASLLVAVDIGMEER